jgi:perosamine synthetase
VSKEFEKKLCIFFDAPAARTFSKGRVALYAALKVLGLGPDDEVLVPGYTCMVVPDTVLFLGAKPVYVDIDPSNFNINPELLEKAFSSHTRALIVQHTYGIPCKIDEIKSWAAERNIFLIEDCCHAFGSRYNGKLLGTFGEVSFFSGGWNKPFSTGLGGWLVIPQSRHTEWIVKALDELIENEACTPGFSENLFFRSQILVHRILVWPGSTNLIGTLYRILSNMGLMIRSFSKTEPSTQVSERYFSKMSPCQASLGCKKIDHIKENIASRLENAAFYHENLPRIGLDPIRLYQGDDPVFVRYPVRVGNKQELLEKAMLRGIELGSWFESPLHPAGTNLNLLGYKTGMCPVSERACMEVVNLPTHSRIGHRHRQRVISFLEKYALPPKT